MVEAYYKTDQVLPVMDLVHKALISPGRFRRRIIKLVFPEVVGLAGAVKDFYWNADVNFETDIVERVLGGKDRADV